VNSADQEIDFMTQERFIQHMNQIIPADASVEVHGGLYRSTRMVTYQRFRTEIYPTLSRVGRVALDALVVWTQIRSFIKGSIEAVLAQRPLTLEEYLDTKVFGSERCRLNRDQRKEAYESYIRYQAFLDSEVGWWDEADRIGGLLRRSKLEPLGACNGRGFDYEKVYVDEVQDCTQAEVVLFFLATGMNMQALFLAGDPAQVTKQYKLFQ
jgi:superfamily I DNA/RNA helicase